MPGWMRDWPISHPGFEESRQLHDWDEELCEGVGALEGARFYNPGEEKISWEFRIKKHVLPAKDTQYYDVRFNFPVSGSCCISSACFSCFCILVSRNLPAEKICRPQ